MLKHVAIIPDGNRRWAKRNNKSFYDAYKKGIEKFKEVIEKWWPKYDFKYLSIYALSYENILNRPSYEKNLLFSLFEELLNNKDVHASLERNKILVRIVGKIELLPKDLQQKLKDFEKKFQDGEKVLNILIGYGGTIEIISAINSIIKNKITEVSLEDFRSYLWVKKDVDLVIRTGGYHRLSNLLLFQSAYAELYFIDKLWPDITIEDLDKAIDWYYNIKRNFGR